MSKIGFLSKLLLFTILVLSTTFASPVTDNSQYSPNNPTENAAILQTCMEKMKLNEVQTLLKQRNTKQIFHNLGCGVHCSYEKAGLITEDNKIDVVKMMKMADSENKTELSGLNGNVNLKDLEECSNETNALTFDDSCDMFAHLVECIENKKNIRRLQ